MSYFQSKRLLRLPEVLHLTGMSRSALYNNISRGFWPRPVKIGLRSVAWLEIEITQIIEARISGKSNEDIIEMVKELTSFRSS